MNYLPSIIDIAEQAGQAILAVYQQDNAAFDITGKADDSPLTAADLAAHQLIVKALTALTPELPILSQQAADISWDIRKIWHRYWLVDPLDGTKEFIKRNGEFTVNIALIDNGEPMLGVIHAPVLGKTYSAAKGEGAFVKTANETRAIHVAKQGATAGDDDPPNDYDDDRAVEVEQGPPFCMIIVGGLIDRRHIQTNRSLSRATDLDLPTPPWPLPKSKKSFDDDIDSNNDCCWWDEKL